MFKAKMTYKDKDFTKENLPKNRRQQFFYLLKNEWRTLLSLLGLYFIALLPFVVSIFLKVFGDFSSETIKMVVTFIITMISQIIMALLLSGSLRIYRLMVFNEGFLFFPDFLYGIKQNFKHVMVNTIIFILLELSLLLVSVYNVGENTYIIYFILMGVYDVLFYPVFLYINAETAVYENNYLISFINASKMSIKNFPFTLLFVLYILAIHLLSAIGGIPLIVYMICLLFLFIFLPIYTLIYFLFSISRFDKYINIRLAKDLYRKGLFEEEDASNN